MTTSNWIKYHEGWLGALMIAIGAFSLGILCTVTLEGRVYTTQMTLMSTECNKMLDQKDHLIDKLSVATVASATNSLKATTTAQDAVKQMQTMKDEKKENKGGH